MTRWHSVMPWCALALAACGGVEGVEEAQDVEASSLPIPADWVGWELGVRPHIEVEGPARIVAPEDLAAEVREEGVARTAPPAGADADTSWRVARADTGLVYRVRFDAEELRRLAETLVARGGAAPFRPLDPALPIADEQAGIAALPQPPQLPEGWQATWANGNDSRTRRGIADGYPANIWPYRAIGHFTSGEGCTGTLIGRRTVLTAAHCVARQGVGFSFPNFRPRSDNTQNPPQLEPYGTAKVVSVWTPAQYTDPDVCANTGAASEIACNRYDIAVAELDEDLGNQTGGFGFGVTAGATLETWDFWMRGYPSCNPAWSDRPSTCPGGSAPQRNAALWGDVAHCDIGAYFSPDGDGWNREISVGCDASRGMSGSAWYTLQSPLNPGNPIAYGVYSQTLCVAAGCAGDAFPNDITRITPAYSSAIVTMKSMWGG